MNTKLHAICDSQGRPIDLFVTAGPVSDYTGARALPQRNQRAICDGKARQGQPPYDRPRDEGRGIHWQRPERGFRQVRVEQLRKVPSADNRPRILTLAH